jgi:hypothetical protein
MNTSPPERLVLRNLPFVSRLVIAAFLLSVGIGYFSALVQLHFQHAKKGELLPGAEDSKKIFSLNQDTKPVSQMEHLLTADKKEPFNGTGSMVKAFFERSEGWKQELRNRKTAKDKALLHEERDGERLALVEWIQKGADKKAFVNNGYTPSDTLRKHPITADYFDEQNKTVRIRDIFKDRCVVCHSAADGKDDNAKNYPVESYQQVKEYCKVRKSKGAMSLTKLAQTTHVHLLGFAMLYGITGLIFSFTSFPFIVRALVAPLPLIAQVVDIACWWLARLDPMYAYVIPITGILVAAGLFSHIIGSMLNLFGKTGKAIVFIIFVAGCIGAGILYVNVISPYLDNEAVEVKVANGPG